MGLSGRKYPYLSRPNPCGGGFVDQNGSRGFVERGVGIGTKKSLQSAKIEEIVVELREEYHFLEEKRRELDFLDKGGDPLDFKFGNSVLLDVQSPSVECMNKKRKRVDA